MRLPMAILQGSCLVLIGCSQDAARPQPRKYGINAAATTDKTKTTEDKKTGSEGDASADKPAAGTPVDNAIPAGPTSTAVTVAAGSVSFDLASAKPALPGASMTANLTANAAAGAVAASITLSNIAIKAPATTGFVLYRPVLVLIGADGKEQQFSIGTNIKINIPQGRTVPLGGTTSASFEGIAAGAQIKMRFSALEPLANALLDGIPNYRECKAAQSFQPVATALQPCKACHSGLFAYEFMEKDNATACGMNLKIIDRSLSGTGTIPAIPGGAHQGVNAGAVSSAVASWRTAEGL